MSADVLKRSKVSVIVPVYNVEKYMEECVDSILNQTYPDLEIILVDDGSPDNSGLICDRYAKQYPSKIKVVHKTNGGLSSARNAGIDVATGEYVAFVDSDDKILPEMYSDMVTAMERHQVDVVASSFTPWVGEGSRGHRVAPPVKNEITASGNEVLSLCLNWTIDRSAVTKLYRKSAIGDLRFHEGLTNEDFPFICELYMRQNLIHVLPKGYYMYRYNDSSITSGFKDSFFDIFTNLDYVDPLISGDNKPLRSDFERYSLQMHIMSALRIVRNKKNKEYKVWLRKNRKYILHHWKSVVFDPKISFRWRVKAAIAFLRFR